MNSCDNSNLNVGENVYDVILATHWPNRTVIPDGSAEPDYVDNDNICDRFQLNIHRISAGSTTIWYFYLLSKGTWLNFGKVMVKKNKKPNNQP